MGRNACGCGTQVGLGSGGQGALRKQANHDIQLVPKVVSTRPGQLYRKKPKRLLKGLVAEHVQCCPTWMVCGRRFLLEQRGMPWRKKQWSQRENPIEGIFRLSLCGAAPSSARWELQGYKNSICFEQVLACLIHYQGKQRRPCFAGHK